MELSHWRGRELERGRDHLPVVVEALLDNLRQQNPHVADDWLESALEELVRQAGAGDAASVPDRRTRLIRSLREGMSLDGQVIRLTSSSGAVPDGTGVVHGFSYARLRDTLRFDAALVIGGLPLVLIREASDQPSREVASRLAADLHRTPALSVVVLWAVAIGREGGRVGQPGEPAETWTLLDRASVDELITPDVLAVFPHRYTTGQSLASPMAVRAAEKALTRVQVGHGGMLCHSHRGVEVITWLARVLAHDAQQQVFLVTAKLEHQKVLERKLQDLSPTDLVSLRNVGDFESEPPSKHTKRPSVLLLFGADSGFRGERGWAMRQAYPDAPIFALTALRPEALPEDLLHAFAWPADEMGVMDAEVDIGEAGIVNEELLYSRFGVSDEELGAMAVETVRRLARSGSLERTLILVGSSDVAKDITAAIAGDGIDVVNAAAWGEAHEGWRELAQGQRVVIRQSWPHHASVPLSTVVVARNLSRQSLGRLRLMLARPATGKSAARLLHLVRPAADRKT